MAPRCSCGTAATRRTSDGPIRPASSCRCTAPSAWTPTGKARPTGPPSSSGTATARRTSSGTSTPTAPSPVCSPGCAWTPRGPGRRTVRRSFCGRATAARTSSGACGTDPLGWRTEHTVRRPNLIRRLTVCAGLTLTAASVLVAISSPVQAATAITINGASGGRALDGIGAVSGGGGNSRLLIDYPEPQRSDILDYLFKPGYGAAMQILKVEIGGDTNSTSGAEPSHEHTRGSVNCNRGYEWWLMEQAKARNPNLTLVGLVWGAPGWIGNGNFWSTDSIDYLIAWLGCATSHGLTIDYLGGCNERGRDLTWYKNLRSALNSRGYPGVKIVASDEFGWGTADDAQRDSAFANAVSVVGSHY